MAFKRQTVKLKQPKPSASQQELQRSAMLQAFGHAPHGEVNRQAMRLEHFKTDTKTGKAKRSHYTLGTKNWSRFKK